MASSCNAAVAQFCATQLAGGGGGPVDEIRDADAELGQHVLFGGQEHRPGESAGTEQLPESIPRAGEVQAELGREQPGIDAAEQDAQIRTVQIGESLLHVATR